MEIQVAGFRRILAGGLAVLAAAACGEMTAVRSGSTSSTSKLRSPTEGELTGPAARAFLQSAALDAARRGDSSLLEQLLTPPSRRPLGPLADLGGAPTATGWAYADAKYNPYYISYAGAETQYWGSFNSGYVRVKGDFYQGGTLQFTDEQDVECSPGSPLDCPDPAAVVTHVRWGDCGASVDANGHHEAWQRVNGNQIGATWHMDTFATNAQPSCSCDGGGDGGSPDAPPLARLMSTAPSDNCSDSGGGGGGGRGMSCYTDDECWDAYDADTLEYLWTWCGPTTVCDAT